MLAGRAVFRHKLWTKEGEKAHEQKREKTKWLEEDWSKGSHFTFPTPTQACAVVADSEGDLPRLLPCTLRWCPDENEGKLSPKKKKKIMTLWPVLYTFCKNQTLPVGLILSRCCYLHHVSYFSSDHLQQCLHCYLVQILMPLIAWTKHSTTQISFVCFL